MATRYGLDSRDIESRRGRDFLCPPDRPRYTPKLLYSGHHVFPGGRRKQPECGVDHPLFSRAELWMGLSNISRYLVRLHRHHDLSAIRSCDLLLFMVSGPYSFLIVKLFDFFWKMWVIYYFKNKKTHAIWLSGRQNRLTGVVGVNIALLLELLIVYFWRNLEYSFKEKHL
jgi:hypothetical protein